MLIPRDLQVAASAQASDESSKRQKTAIVSGNDDLDMDKIIQDHFLGMCYAVACRGGGQGGLCPPDDPDHHVFVKLTVNVGK